MFGKQPTMVVLCCVERAEDRAAMGLEMVSSVITLGGCSVFDKTRKTH